MCTNCPLDGPPAVIRTDPAPAFVSLSNDHTHERYRIAIEIGRVKNLNKNPVAKKAVQELEHEITRSITHLRPTNRLTASELAVATSSLNSCIRHHGCQLGSCGINGISLPMTNYLYRIIMPFA